jgi:hypothetical protein
MGRHWALKIAIGAADWLATVTCIVALAILAVYAADLEPPFAVLQVDRPAGKPGQEVAFHAETWRDRSRQCTAQRFASAYHSDGLRTDYPIQFYSDAQIAHQEEATPGRMAPTFRIPENAVPGRPAYMMMTLHYRCNQAHYWFRPIEVRVNIAFDVLAP